MLGIAAWHVTKIILGNIYLPLYVTYSLFSFDAGVDKFGNISLVLPAWHEVYMEGSRAEQIDYFGGV